TTTNTWGLRLKIVYPTFSLQLINMQLSQRINRIAQYIDEYLIQLTRATLYSWQLTIVFDDLNLRTMTLLFQAVLQDEQGVVNAFMNIYPLEPRFVKAGEVP